MTPREWEQERIAARGVASPANGADLSPRRLAWTDPQTRERFEVELTCTGSSLAALEAAGFERVAGDDIEPDTEPIAAGPTA
jgi:hypothetical protein